VSDLDLYAAHAQSLALVSAPLLGARAQAAHTRRAARPPFSQAAAYKTGYKRADEKEAKRRTRGVQQSKDF
jgi:hypothetical protein